MDAVAGAVEHFLEIMAQDAEEIEKEKADRELEAEIEKWLEAAHETPFGIGHNGGPPMGGLTPVRSRFGLH